MPSMPDQYGDPRPGRDTPPTPKPDYAAAAKRGIALIRQTMGWHRDETTEANNPISSHQKPVTKHPPAPNTPKRAENPPKRNTAPINHPQEPPKHPQNNPT